MLLSTFPYFEQGVGMNTINEKYTEVYCVLNSNDIHVQW